MAQDWSAVFTDVFTQPESDVEAQVWAEVLGDEYPAELAPYSYTTRSELARMAQEVRVGAGDLLADVGSGRGGPGLWVAATTGASYCAVDIAQTGLDEVQRRAERLGLADRVQTRLGRFEELPFEGGEVAAVMSVDALLFTPDKQAALHELARVLRPGGRLVLTTWDYSRTPEGRPPQVPDHRPLIEAAGLRLVAYDDTPDWEQRQRAIHARLLERVEELAAEDGSDPEEVRAGLVEMEGTTDCMIRRVLMVAEKA
jgi:ubiquinone/menaquinone biosynthesis C-methylase UbiE